MARLSPADILTRLEKVTGAWQELAPDASFYGLTLKQFRTATAPSRASRHQIQALQNRLSQTIERRDVADARTMKLLLGVVESVKGTPTHGEDGALYASMGYVRKSVKRKRRRAKRQTSTR